VFTKEKQAANPCHIAMLAMHFLEELSSSSNFFVAAAAAASFQVRCAEVWKKKEMTITGSLRLWLAAARRVLLYTQKRNFSFLCILGSALNKRQLGAERKESHTHCRVYPSCVLFSECASLQVSGREISLCRSEPGQPALGKIKTNRASRCKQAGRDAQNVTWFY
jgi:hypothetical protein